MSSEEAVKSGLYFNRSIADRDMFLDKHTDNGSVYLSDICRIFRVASSGG